MFDELRYDEDEWVVSFAADNGGYDELPAEFDSDEAEDRLDKTKVYECDSETVGEESYGPGRGGDRGRRRVLRIGEIIGDRE